MLLGLGRGVLQQGRLLGRQQLHIGERFVLLRRRFHFDVEMVLEVHLLMGARLVHRKGLLLAIRCRILHLTR